MGAPLHRDVAAALDEVLRLVAEIAEIAAPTDLSR